MAIRKAGTIKVQQAQGKHLIRRDFDAQEWGYEWHKQNGVDFVRLLHDADPSATDTYDFVDYSCPVSVEFEYEG